MLMLKVVTAPGLQSHHMAEVPTMTLFPANLDQQTKW